MRAFTKVHDLIIEMFEARLRTGWVDFTVQDLQHYVAHRLNRCSPDTPSRVMRDLRQRGKIKYKLLSRAVSCYRVLGVSAGALRGRKATKTAQQRSGNPYEALLAPLPPKLLRKVYRLLIFETHPDRCGDPQLAAQVNAAWQRLSKR